MNMKIKVKMTNEELESMGVTEAQLTETILNRLDATVRNKIKIFHQVELEVVTKVKKSKLPKE